MENQWLLSIEICKVKKKFKIKRTGTEIRLLLVPNSNC